jgi:magnesium transporter
MQKCGTISLPTVLKITFPSFLFQVTDFTIFQIDNFKTLAYLYSMRSDKHFTEITDPDFDTGRTKEIFGFNPVIPYERDDAKESRLYVYSYNAASVEKAELKNVRETFRFLDCGKVSWINVDGLYKPDVELISNHFGIHPLLVEDILSIGQRPKMDDIEGVVFCLLNMLYFNEDKCTVEQEQISIVLGKGFVITFQEDAKRDVFKSIRDKLSIANSKLRLRGADYLCYSLLDVIVDHYFEVMENLGDKIELLEEEIARDSNKKSLGKLNGFRKEMIVLKRNVSPVRDIINGFIKSENELLDDKINKYFKDVYDHIIQANDVADNYRDLLTSLQDLYINQVNLKMNEVMKVMAIVTCLLAPAAVIGGIFGMNFDVIPYSHQRWGFYITVAIMLVVPLVMLGIFKKRGWF